MRSFLIVCGLLWVGLGTRALAVEAEQQPPEPAAQEAAEAPAAQVEPEKEPAAQEEPEKEPAAQEEPEKEAAQVEPKEEPAVLEDIETILTQPLGQDEYVEAERCLSRYSFHSVDIIDDAHVLFSGRRGKAWLNTLRRPCIGLNRRDIPKFEYRASSQLCNLDDFVGMDSGFSGFTRTSASCALGDFQPVTPEQVALIKATVESRRGSRTRKKKDPGDQ